MRSWLRRVAVRPIYFAAFVQHFNHFFAELVRCSQVELEPLQMQKEV
jgi:hypothetical protein